MLLLLNIFNHTYSSESLLNKYDIVLFHRFVSDSSYTLAKKFLDENFTMIELLNFDK